ncbi:MAG TPA: peptide deformylase [Candidatus Saccharimonadales bacterium]|nr:peptide deformylase [Candidatus Saccharimonadales bacterium]
MNKTITKDDIITLPNPHLRQRSGKVSFVTPEIEQLVADMQNATIDWENSREHEVGVALAAIQIGVLKRIVVVRNDFNDKDNHDFTVFINPLITKYEGKVEKDYEGCLSVKSVYGVVPRYTKVRVKAMGLDGKEFRVTAEGFLARIFQHEIDHTNGIVFVDHIRDDRGAFHRLTDKGELEPVDYDSEIKDNPDLWED